MNHDPIAPACPTSNGTEGTATSVPAALHAVPLALVSNALTACGGGGGDTPSVTSPSGGVSISLPSAGFAYHSPASDEDAARFLLQAQFSASPADISALRATSYATWIERQAALPLGQTGWDWLNTKGYGDVLNPANYFDSTSPGDYMIWNQLITAPDALRKRVALALSEIFVVSLSSLTVEWRSHAIAHYWDTLSRHALGNYRDLLGEITLNPAMGFFLNTKGNKKEDGKGSQPDENYAREVMQLFTIGLHQLNRDGSVKTDGNGQWLDSYTAADVSNLARVFTGYDFDYSQNVVTPIPRTGGGTRNVGSTAAIRLPMAFNNAQHSPLASTFLGTTIAAGTSGPAALQTALDTLFNHPNTGPFICRQLIQRLVTSNPSPAFVGRVSAVFEGNGAGYRGDLAQVVAAILMDDEARSPAGLSQAEFGKLREPMLRLVQWARTFGVTSVSGAWKITDLSDPGTRLGQSPLRAPSVFNFFRPGYVPPGSSLSAGAVAPEFQLVTESSVGGYLNFMMTTISSGMNSSDITTAYPEELALVTDADALVRRVNLLMSAGQLSGANHTLIVNALNATPIVATSSASARRNRVSAAILMVMASAEYLIQK
jgi:uncharacterized protein (DUF1800 family)